MWAEKHGKPGAGRVDRPGRHLFERFQRIDAAILKGTKLGSADLRPYAGQALPTFLSGYRF